MLARALSDGGSKHWPSGREPCATFKKKKKKKKSKVSSSLVGYVDERSEGHLSTELTRADLLQQAGQQGVASCCQSQTARQMEAQLLGRRRQTERLARDMQETKRY
jgi:hypothetical protein